MRILLFAKQHMYSNAMRIILPCLISLVACAPFPKLETEVSESARNAPFPRLTPIQTTIPTVLTSPEAEVAARVAALNARAESLRKIEFGALQ